MLLRYGSHVIQLPVSAAMGLQKFRVRMSRVKEKAAPSCQITMPNVSESPTYLNLKKSRIAPCAHTHELPVLADQYTCTPRRARVDLGCGPDNQRLDTIPWLGNMPVRMGKSSRLMTSTVSYTCSCYACVRIVPVVACVHSRACRLKRVAPC